MANVDDVGLQNLIKIDPDSLHTEIRIKEETFDSENYIAGEFIAVKGEPSVDKEDILSCETGEKDIFDGVIVKSEEISSNFGDDINRGKTVTYPCNVCKERFTSAYKLRIHQRLHTGEKHQCVVCKKTFNNCGNIKRHMKIHTDGKLQCDVCNKSFVDSDCLKVHMRIHNGEKPYQCDVCKKSFSQSSALKCHKMIHTGEKPYQCHVCKSSFNQLCALKRHIGIHPGAKPYQCDV